MNAPASPSSSSSSTTTSLVHSNSCHSISTGHNHHPSGVISPHHHSFHHSGSIAAAPLSLSRHASSELRSLLPFGFNQPPHSSGMAILIPEENPQEPSLIDYHNKSHDSLPEDNNNNTTPYEKSFLEHVYYGSSLTTALASFSSRRRTKPSRTLLYIRNRASTKSLMAMAAGLILAILSAHRIFSIYMTNRRWINAPITYMARSCPLPEYELLTEQQPNLLSSTTTTTSSSSMSSSSSSSSSASTTPRINICLTTLTDSQSSSLLQRFLRWRNYDGIIEMTWQNKADYAAKHGYLLYDGSALIDTSRPPAWTKIRAVQYLLQNERCDWAMWLDADTVIMNSNIRIESFLPTTDAPQDMLVGTDKGWGYNSGVFLFRNTPWSHQFLQDWWNMKHFVRPPGFSLSGDNAALKAQLRDLPSFDQHVLVPPRCTLNSFAQFLPYRQSLSIMENLDEQVWYLSPDYYHKGDFIAHTPGYDNKEECLRLLLREAQ